jgi:hypothetical protein
MLAARLADGSLLLAIVLLISFEAALLAWLWYRRRTGLAPRGYLGNLVSGAALMMAVRAASLDQSSTAVAGWLLAALAAHAADLFVRWQRPGRRAGPTA